MSNFGYSESVRDASYMELQTYFIAESLEGFNLESYITIRTLFQQACKS